MNTLAVEKRTVPVSIRFEDGHSVTGDIYLSPIAQKHLGRETVMDFMNTDQNFFPLKLSPDSRVIMINKARVVEVTVAMDIEFADTDLAALGAKEEPMTVMFQCDYHLAGTAYIEMPPRKSRIIDFLNGGSGFFLLKSGDRAHILNSQHISYVTPGR